MITPEPHIENETPVHTSRPKLLLADDSVTIRRVVELTFADEGIDVTTAADAASAMEKFVEIQPDIVLVDVGLAGTSGYQICEMIKQDEATRHIPVLLLVGSFEPFDQDQAERACADGFLTKPFQSIRDLVARVSELLSQSDQNAVEPAVAEDADAVVAGSGDLSVDENSSEAEPGEKAAQPEVEDIENLYQRSFVDTAEIEEFDTVDDLLGDPGLDDELIEASYQSDDASEPSLETVETKGFSWSPSEPAEADAAAETPAAEEEGSLDKTLSDFEMPSVDVTETPADTVPPTVEPTEPAEPSPEFIALVAQRVVERLSDKAVRDIAKEAVPRIAEKLIREALAEEKKP